MKTALVLLAAYATIAAGAVILAVGIERLPEPYSPYPNTQHISPAPYPNRR